MIQPPLHLPPREDDSHKGNFGRVLLIGGSRGMSGSVALSAMAALKTGSGLVSAFVPDVCLETVASFHPGVMTIPAADNEGHFAAQAAQQLPSIANDFSAIGCGPGMTTHKGSRAIVDQLLLTNDVPRIFDADALNVLALENWTQRLGGPIVLTPHPGELQRLTSISSQDRERQIDAAADLASQTGCVVVVKGGPTVVVSGERRWTNSTGNPGMATAGSGDVLTGVITSLLGQGLDPFDAARLGVWIHAVAGDLAADQYSQAGMTCVEILQSLGSATQFATGKTESPPTTDR